MEMNRVRKKLGISITVSLAIGLMLLATGIALKLLDVKLLENDKALIGLAIIPLALATYYILTAALAKKNPSYLRNIAVQQADERIAALKHTADSISFRTLQWSLTAVFLGYTLAFPSQIFSSAGWWITFGFFFLSQTLQAVVMTVLIHRDQKNAGES